LTESRVRVSGMTTEPSSQPSSPAALRDTRWIGAAIWGAALIALLATSWAAVGGPFGGLNFVYLAQIGPGDDPDRNFAAAVELVFTVGIAAVLLLGWWALARATHGLIVALSDSSDTADDEPVPGVWLTEDGRRSPLSDLASYAGAAWALIILRPVVVISIQVFTA
jgi:hypothetical protein